VQRINDVVNSALQTPGLGACLNTWIGPGLVLTNANLPYVDATKSTAELATYTNSPVAVDGTPKQPVPATGRSTVYVASDILSNKDEAMRTFIHETGNALAMQNFSGGTNAGAYLGPRGGAPSAAQRNDPIDHDIGNQIERCVFGPPRVVQSVTVTAN